MLFYFVDKKGPNHAILRLGHVFVDKSICMYLVESITRSNVNFFLVVHCFTASKFKASPYRKESEKNLYISMVSMVKN